MHLQECKAESIDELVSRDELGVIVIEPKPAEELLKLNGRNQIQ